MEVDLCLEVKTCFNKKNQHILIREVEPYQEIKIRFNKKNQHRLLMEVSLEIKSQFRKKLGQFRIQNPMTLWL